MIVDSSALVAVISRENGWESIFSALNEERSLIAAPTLLEYRRVVWSRGEATRAISEGYLQILLRSLLSIEPFTANDAGRASEANKRWGKGNGGALNFGDLMVYAVAVRTGLPVLCTGPEFAGAGLPTHPASRPY